MPSRSAQQREVEVVGRGEDLLQRQVAGAHADPLGADGGELLAQVAEPAGLSGAADRHGVGVEEQDDRPLAELVGEPPRRSVGVRQARSRERRAPTRMSSCVRAEPRRKAMPVVRPGRARRCVQRRSNHPNGVIAVKILRQGGGSRGRAGEPHGFRSRAPALSRHQNDSRPPGGRAVRRVRCASCAPRCDRAVRDDSAVIVVDLGLASMSDADLVVAPASRRPGSGRRSAPRWSWRRPRARSPRAWPAAGWSTAAPRADAGARRARRLPDAARRRPARPDARETS